MRDYPITITHNLDPSSFVYLWAKYVRGVNLERHCTNCLRGAYSRSLSKPNNPLLKQNTTLVLDEYPVDSFKAVYICGVSSQGYRRRPKANYPHNLHLPIYPQPGVTDTYRFEDWIVEISNGRAGAIPGKDTLPLPWAGLPDEYTTCRIFRWAVAHRDIIDVRCR